MSSEMTHPAETHACPRSLCIVLQRYIATPSSPIELILNSSERSIGVATWSLSPISGMQGVRQMMRASALAPLLRQQPPPQAAGISWRLFASDNRAGRGPPTFGAVHPLSHCAIAEYNERKRSSLRFDASYLFEQCTHPIIE